MSQGLYLCVSGPFIHDGVIGKRFVEVARDTLQKQTVELDVSKKVETFEAHGNLVQPLDFKAFKAGDQMKLKPKDYRTEDLCCM